MAIVSDIPIPKIKVVNVNDAHNGALLQIQSKNDTKIVALRSELPVATGPVKGVIMLEGLEAGRFCPNTELPYVALDITDLASLAVTDPTPCRPAPIQPGVVYLATDVADQPFICMAVALQRQQGIVGYVHLDGLRRGDIENVKHPPIPLGKAAVVPLGCE
jgi:hypothetical protein